MGIFRKKIKETPKRGLYGNRHSQSSNYSVWDNMSFIEQIVMVSLPCLLGFIFYMILDMTGMVVWLKIIISIGMVIGCIGLITLIVNYFHEM